MTTRSKAKLPLPVVCALRKLGADICDARRRRAFPPRCWLSALISRMTLGKVERGDAGASAGAYATVLFVLGMTDRLADLADPRHDVVGVALEDERLPKRIRLPKRPQRKAAD